ncbi:MAG TPA: hypothetical protein VK325_11310, partial [Pseudoxanthomonas sp.]|nr:hypothetical protein [Pseudoxanthomonas sp.]
MPVLLKIAACAAVVFAPLVATAAGAQAPSGSDALAPVMAGEFALQAGKLPDAARWYLEAAQAEDDPGLAELATRIALLANDDARAADALALWRQRAPESLAMRAADAALALRRGDADATRRGLQTLMSDSKGWRYALTVLGGGGRDPRLASTLLGELLDKNLIPNQLQAWLAFGGLAQALGEMALAERIVGVAVERFPSEPRVALLHASQLRRAEKPEQARAILDGLMPQAAGEEALRLALAREYDALGAPGAAAAALAQGPQDTATFGLRASLLAKAEDTPALTALYDELRKNASQPDP